MRKHTLLILIIILCWACFIRFYRLSQVPPSLSWDEASIGYDAWSLTRDGKDQWGKIFPYIFQSFGEYKYPTHIYFTALIVKLFGLSDLTVRLSSVLMSIVNILLLFFLVRKLSGNEFVAIFASLFLTISPWHIQFSRINWETNFGLFFFMTGLLSFLYSFRKPSFLILAYSLFGFSLYTYNAAKIFISIFILAITIIYKSDLWKLRKYFSVGVLIFLLFLLANVLNPQISGIVRLKQVSFSNEQIFSTNLFQLTKNRHLGQSELIFTQYLSHFSPNFLFISGDKNPRHSSQMTGELLWFDAVLIPVGLLALIKLRNKWSSMLLLWFFLGPLPGAIVTEAPHASRAMFSLGGWQAVSAFGFYNLYNFFKKSSKIFWSVSIIIIITLTFIYLKSYFVSYPVLYSQDWQYGYKELFLGYQDQFKNFDKVIISDEYGQPYIFALYYLKYNPEQFRAEVKYNPVNNRGFSTVSKFGKFEFQKIDQTLNTGLERTLIFASPSERLKNLIPFAQIKFLDGRTAFWVYNLNNKN